MQLTLMTYNIHKGIGGIDRKYRLDRIVDTVTHYAPQIVLLQEVDDGVPRSRRERQIDRLADALNFPHLAYQANVKLRTGTYGNALLSQFPILESHDVDLTIRPKKRRRAQIVKLRVSGRGIGTQTSSRTMVVVNVHLGLAAFERKLQLRKLLKNETFSHRQSATPTIIAGDFNDVWQNLGVGLMHKHQFRSALGRSKTFPAAFPLRCLDGIYYAGELRLVRCFAGHTDLARQASDHLPVIGEFRVDSRRDES